MALQFRDFLPRLTHQGSTGFLGIGASKPEFDDFESAVEAAGEWLEATGIEPMQIETVVLPNIHEVAERGTTDSDLRASGDVSTYWYQFLRVWYSE